MSNPKLPCDVHLPPNTVIRAGCSLSTLHTALRVRGMDTSPAPAKEELRLELAKAFHDGPLGADDYEFLEDGQQAQWCLDVVDFFLSRLTPSQEQGEPDFYAVYAGTMHVGLWPNKAHAEEACREIEGATITPLYARPQPAVGGVTESVAVPEITDELVALRRLGNEDEIAFSQDGDNAWFTQGDRAWISGETLIKMREKGWLKRISLDGENYRGFSERDVISDAGANALEAALSQEGEG